MTRVVQKEYDITIKETSFVEVFKDLGYETYWFSKHSPQKRVHTFCEEASLCEYVAETPYDADLLNRLAFLEESNKNTLVVLHTLGSHLDYNERVPDSFKHYQPLCKGNVSGCAKEELSNSYDNTILYTDAFIANVIEKLKDKNACLIYTSDHGESLGEGEILQRYGHATPYAIAPEAQKNVPFLLWFSKKYLQSHQEIDIDRVRKNREVSHDNVFDTIIDCGGISHKDEKRKKLTLLGREEDL
jgi:KDO II ethanolaminephosphotransferase